jgi:hypothetical protein
MDPAGAQRRREAPARAEHVAVPVHETLQLPIRALADWLLSPAHAVQRSEAGGNAERPGALARASGHLELALLDVADAARMRGREAAVRALTAARELTVGAMSMPVALADLAFVNWLYLAMERRPQPAPPGVRARCGAAAVA